MRSPSLPKMQCPRCQSTQTRKNGHASSKQRFYCKTCQRSFVQSEIIPISATPTPNLQLSPEIHAKVLPLIEYLINIQSLDGIGVTVEKLLQILTSIQSLETINLRPTLDRNHSSTAEISILLLDAENLNKFDAHIEKFLAGLSPYPLGVKIAFANWKNTSGDSELYERGYQMIHVPLGKNSADAQMLAMGSAIRLHYPQAKEVFICSSDWLLNHLCNELQNQGLMVYRVRREDDNFVIENRATGEIHYYSTTYNIEVPSLAEFAHKIEQLIQAEHHSLTERLAQLSTVMNLFQQRTSLEKKAQSGSPLKGEDTLILDSVNPLPESAISQIEELEEKSENLVTSVIPTYPEIANRADLEKAMIKIVANLTAPSPCSYISISKLSCEFHQQYGKTYKEISSSLSIKSKFLVFLQSCSALSVKKEGTVYEVSLAQP